MLPSNWAMVRLYQVTGMLSYRYAIDLSKKQRYVSSKMHYGKSELKNIVFNNT